MRWLLNWLEGIVRDEVQKFKREFFCHKCGTRTNKSKVFCNHCGYPVGGYGH